MANSQKLSKSRKPKGEKSKKPSKNRNLPNFDTTEAGASFLTPGTRKTFNRLQLTFTKALILQYFNLECHIWIKTNVSSYAIDDILSQLASVTRPNRVVTKINLG